MAEYWVCANVIYADFVEADSPEEAAELFENKCPYDVDGEVFVIDQETHKTYEL